MGTIRDMIVESEMRRRKYGGNVKRKDDFDDDVDYIKLGKLMDVRIKKMDKALDKLAKEATAEITKKYAKKYAKKKMAILKELAKEAQAIGKKRGVEGSLEAFLQYMIGASNEFGTPFRNIEDGWWLIE